MNLLTNWLKLKQQTFSPWFGASYSLNSSTLHVELHGQNLNPGYTVSSNLNFPCVCSDLDPLPAERHPSQQKDPEQRLRELGANDSGSTAPRSTEGSISEDVFTESELSPIREEEQASNEDLRLDKSSGASTESVQTVAQVEAICTTSQAEGSAHGKVSQSEEPTVEKAEDNPPDTATENDSQSPMGSKQHSVEKPPSTPTTTSSSTSQAQGPSSSTSRPGSQSSDNPGATETTSISASPQGDATEGADGSKTDTMQQGKEEKENVEGMQKDTSQNSTEGKNPVTVSFPHLNTHIKHFKSGFWVASRSRHSHCFLITFLFPLCLGASNWNVETKGNGSAVRRYQLGGASPAFQGFMQLFDVWLWWSGPLLWVIS